MKIDILSDLHLDFVINPWPTYKVACIQALYDKILSYDADVLIVAGDMSHYNSQTFIVLNMLVDIYGYKRIYIVTGNHDYYLINKNQRSKYRSSLDRAQEIWSYKDPRGVIIPLNGTLDYFEGVTFGGLGGWYDGSYLRHFPAGGWGYGSSNIDTLWKRSMNDHANMRGIDTIYDLIAQERPKFDAIVNECDVLISHVCPISQLIAVDEEYREDKTSALYCFDGEKEIKEAENLKLIVYGHSHGSRQFELHDKLFVMNTFGYPSESCVPTSITEKDGEFYVE